MEQLIADIPEVSVIMSVFNDGHFLRKAIESILYQTYTDFEFLIIDDGSDSNTKKILSYYQQKDSRIKILVNKENLGLTKNLNRGIRQARGKFIARMDGDDISLPSRFEKQVAVLKNNPQVVVVGTSTFEIDKNDRIKKIDIRPTCSWEVLWISIFRPPLPHPSAMIRKNTLIQNNLFYNETFKTAQDFDFWSQMIKKGTFKILQEPLLKYRTHKANISSTRKSNQKANGKQITKENILYYFPQTARKYSLEIEHLCDLLYSDEKMNARSIACAVKGMERLCNAYVKKKSEIKKVKIQQLAVRWLIMGLLSNMNLKPICKMYGFWAMRRYWYSVLLEARVFSMKRASLLKR